MKTRKSRLTIMIALMALVLIAAMAVPAFAEETVSDAEEATVNTQNQSAAEDEKTEPENEADEYSGLSREEQKELEAIYARFREIRNEFENLHNAHKDELIRLKERARELEEKAVWCDHCCCCQRCRDDWDDFDKSEADSRRERHNCCEGGIELGAYTARGEKPECDIYLEDKTALFPDNPANERVELIERLFDLMSGAQNPSARSNDDSSEAAEKPFVGLVVSSLPGEVVSLTGIEAGALVYEVMENSPAAEAGIQPYDIIIKAGEKKITSSDDLVAVVSASIPGDILRFQLFRQGKELEFDITIKVKNESITKETNMAA